MLKLVCMLHTHTHKHLSICKSTHTHTHTYIHIGISVHLCAWGWHLSVLSSSLSANFFSIAASGVASGFQSALGQTQVHHRLQLCAAFEWCDKENAFRAANEFNTHTYTRPHTHTWPHCFKNLCVSRVCRAEMCVLIKFAVDQRSQK